MFCHSTRGIHRHGIASADELGRGLHKCGTSISIFLDGGCEIQLVGAEVLVLRGLLRLLPLVCGSQLGQVKACSITVLTETIFCFNSRQKIFLLEVLSEPSEFAILGVTFCGHGGHYLRWPIQL